MNLVKPYEVLLQVAKAVPEKCLENIVVIGSLATAYEYFSDDETISMRTKDIDCLLRPFKVAAETGQLISRQLFKCQVET